MFQLRDRLTNLFLAAVDILVTLVTFAVVYLLGRTGWLIAWSLKTPVEETTSPLAISLILPVWILSFSHFRLYRSQRTSSYFSDAFILAKGIGLGTAILAVIKMFYEPLPLTKDFLLAFMLCNLIALTAFRLCMRLILHGLRRRGFNTKSLIIVGTGPLVDQIIEKTESHPSYGYKLIGVFGSQPKKGDPFPRLGKVEDFNQWIENNSPDEVIIALPAEDCEKIKSVIETCEARGVHARIAPDLFRIVRPQVQVYNLDGIPLINARAYPTERIDYLFLKRAFDLSASTFLLIVLMPFLFLIAIAVKWGSPGPVFFRQERVGLNGKKFWIYKFRTMELASRYISDTRWTTARDKRVTRVGRFLRRTSLDELPQLLNVFRGDMSMVGPRPERPHFVEIFKHEIPDYMVRHYMKCGITGWAQVNGWRGDTSIRKRIEYDLYYMQHWAFWFDLKIILLTLARGLYQRNAY